jgi:hypothetical protein
LCVEAEKTPNLGNEAMIVIKNAMHTLNTIYSVYFKWEVSSAESFKIKYEKSRKALFRNLDDFDIFPSLVNKSFINTQYIEIVLHDCISSDLKEELIILKKDKGCVFTLVKYIQLL